MNPSSRPERPLQLADSEQRRPAEGDPGVLSAPLKSSFLPKASPASLGHRRAGSYWEWLFRPQKK